MRWLGEVGLNPCCRFLILATTHYLFQKLLYSFQSSNALRTQHSSHGCPPPLCLTFDTKSSWRVYSSPPSLYVNTVKPSLDNHALSIASIGSGSSHLGTLIGTPGIINFLSPRQRTLLKFCQHASFALRNTEAVSLDVNLWNALVILITATALRH